MKVKHSVLLSADSSRVLRSVDVVTNSEAQIQNLSTSLHESLQCCRHPASRLVNWRSFIIWRKLVISFQTAVHHSQNPFHVLVPPSGSLQLHLTSSSLAPHSSVCLYPDVDRHSSSSSHNSPTWVHHRHNLQTASSPGPPPQGLPWYYWNPVSRILSKQTTSYTPVLPDSWVMRHNVNQPVELLIPTALERRFK